MYKRTEVKLSDWLNDDDDINNKKNNNNNNNNIIEENEERNSNERENKNKEKEEKEKYNQIFTYMKNLQPEAKKKIKKETYSQILNYVKENDLNEESFDLIIRGDRKKDIIGLCELISKKTRMGDFKGSTKEFLNIIYEWFYFSKYSETIIEQFAIDDDYLARMNLGEHYSRLSTSSKKEEKNLSTKVIKIIKAILEKRPNLELKEFIRSGFIENIKEALDNFKEGKEKEEEEEKKKKKNKNKFDLDSMDNIVEDTINIITSEPKTWEEVEKLNKKILTTEFLSFGDNKFDDEKEDEMELIDNFIDPLNNNAHLNIKDYSDNEIAKLHIQMETFDPVFFLEKLYKHMSFNEFSSSLVSIDNNLKEVNEKDEKLIDKNIYKYLDCKKLLDNILFQFKNVTNKSITVFNKDALNFQFVVTDKLNDLKNSFNLIIQSKMCKDILQKLSKYFIMKDKIQHYLKFSNLDDLADYLKKIKIEVKNINQDKIIYGEFYKYFTMIIEKFKSVLTGLIKDSPINETVLKYFKYLIEFDVESEILEQLIFEQKTKMTEKINNYLIKPENTEIKNFKNFFCDEYQVQNISDDIFSSFIKESDNYILSKELSLEEKNKELINVENIVKALLKDINEFLFTMKVLDENLDLKINYSQRACRFNNIVNEIYTYLFDSLERFLFNDDFSMRDLVKINLVDVYNFPENKFISLFVNSYKNNNDYNRNILFNNDFNKNTLQNLSNVIIDIFEKFEFHLDSDRMDFLVNKNVFIAKIYFAFLNEKIKECVNYFCNENTINYTESQMSIFNHSYFDFTKNFIQTITKDYINIINFYMTIVNKVKNIKLPHELIYLSFFFILKSFAIHFYVFYDTETRYNLQEINVNLNGLIIEFIRNLNYLNYIIPLVLKNLFKNKEKDYSIYFLDYKEFLSQIKKIFIEIYINNASENLNKKFINMNDDSNKENVYQDYNNDLILKSNSHDCFSDTRSVLTDIIADIVVCVRDFDLINKENKNDNQEINNENYSNEVIQHIIGLFYDSFLTFAKERNKIILCQEENQKDYDGFKYISQLYLEIQIFNSILSDFTSTEKLKKKFNMIQELLLTYLIIIKKVDNPNRKISENLIYTNDDLQRKNNLIKEYNDNYSSLFKYFINNH
jgi:hypothetical protein